MEVLTLGGVLKWLDNSTLTALMNCCRWSHQERLHFIRWLKFDLETSRQLYQTRPVGWNFCHTLNLSDTKVTDVSKLGSVHTLILYGTEVKDVSMLGKVHTLNLSYTKVTGVSMLGKVHNLNLSRTEVPREQIETLRGQGVNVVF